MTAARNMEAPSGASGSRRYLGRHEIYLPPFGLGRCDLCGAEADEAELSRIEIEPAARGTFVLHGAVKPTYRAARVVYVCQRHRGEDAVGEPITTPNSRLAPGTSQRRPQAEALFDDTGLKRGGRR